MMKIKITAPPTLLNSFRQISPLPPNYQPFSSGIFISTTSIHHNFPTLLVNKNTVSVSSLRREILLSMNLVEDPSSSVLYLIKPLQSKSFCLQEHDDTLIKNSNFPKWHNTVMVTQQPSKATPIASSSCSKSPAKAKSNSKAKFKLQLNHQNQKTSKSKCNTKDINIKGTTAVMLARRNAVVGSAEHKAIILHVSFQLVSQFSTRLISVYETNPFPISRSFLPTHIRSPLQLWARTDSPCAVPLRGSFSTPSSSGTGSAGEGRPEEWSSRRTDPSWSI